MSGTRIPAGARLTVRFVRRWQIYFTGDVATFPARNAANLVNRGIAERVNWAAGDPPPPGAVPGIRPPGEAPRRQGDVGEDDFVL
jgi:hypothetical protein